jgi:hypothetical protein
MIQLCLFGDDDQPQAVSRTTLYWHRRIDRAVRAAFELGRRRRKAIPLPKAAPRPLGAAVAPAVSVSRAGRNELHDLAVRVSRLTINRRDPEWFYCEKDEISAALRAIAQR